MMAMLSVAESVPDAGLSSGGAYTVRPRVVYARPDGHARRMTLWLPDDQGEIKRPAVLLIHGGAWLFGSRRQLGWYGRRLAENGYVAASVSYRMMPRYPFPACLHDCKAAVRWLRLHAEELRIDPGRIAVLGNSAGGHLAAMLATTKPEDGLEGAENPGASSAVRAAIDFYGVADMSYYGSPKSWIRIGGLTRWFMRQFVGKEGSDGRNPYAAASPVTYADQDTCPILFIHGTKDSLVPFDQSVTFRGQLRGLGVPTRLIAVTHGHAFDFFHPRVRAHVFHEIQAFLDEYAGPS